MATCPWYNRPLQTAIEAKRPELPIRKPVCIPPFNVVRASHVELAVRDPVLVAWPVVAR